MARAEERCAGEEVQWDVKHLRSNSNQTGVGYGLPLKAGYNVAFQFANDKKIQNQYPPPQLPSGVKPESTRALSRPLLTNFLA